MQANIQKAMSNVNLPLSMSMSLSMASNHSDDSSVGGDEDSTAGGSLKTYQTDDDDEKASQEELTKKESKVVFRLRLVVLIFLIATAAAVTAVVYEITQHGETEEFETQYEGAALKILQSFSTIAHEMGAISGLAVASSAHSVDHESDWPFVTLSNFQQRARNAMALSNALLVTVAPRVRLDQVEAWDEYVQGEASSWIDEGYAFQEELLLNRFESWSNIEKSRLTDRKVDPMHYFDRTGRAVRESMPSEYFLPIWQTAPVLQTGLVNENQLSRQNFSVPQSEIAKIVLDEEYAVIGGFIATDPGSIQSSSRRTALFATLRSFVEGREVDYLGDPMASVYMPVFDQFNTTGRKAVALMTAVVHWRAYLRNILPSNVNDIDVVLENSCDGSFTYHLRGPEAHVVGPGDHHDPKFDEWKRCGTFDANVLQDGTAKGLKLHKDGCQYMLHVFPTQEFYDQYKTNVPAIITFSIFAAFVFTIVLFLAYDRLVERRQGIVLAKAKQSTAVVAKLFPKQIRDRLIEAEKETVTIGNKTTRLKGFLDGNTEQPKKNDSPIADLFPHCTVSFGDICGFTAWSSTREPSQVFTLLQTVYQAFDLLAKRRKVFKVETIGDSYVAVTGLPEPQENHALIMVRFATDCLHKMSEVTKELECQLGPDTGDLAIRFGLHSGPVTAGVLRGDRARFQLFGDTVNTASRMETTGCRGKIHLSQTTASLLRESGKDHWLKQREDAVTVKGLSVPTFFANPKGRKGSVTSSAEGSSDQQLVAEPKDIKPANQRLVEWMVDLLLDNIKKAVHARKLCGVKGTSSEDVTYIPKKGATCLDEVKEYIEMPKYNSKLAGSSMDAYQEVKIDKAVVEDLKEYVTVIASHYNNNPFHNFQHACHVTMSVMKLLKRVVTPDLTDAELENLKKSNDMASRLHDYTHGINDDPFAATAITLSALIHDVDHRGISNLQLGKEEPQLADRYHMKSLAEQHSVDLAWGILMEKDKYKALRKCLFPTQADLIRFRQLIINVVLATDIFDAELNALRRSRWERAFSNGNNGEGAVVVDDQHKSDLRATIVIEYIIQASDVSHTMQHWHVYQKWNACLFQEMYHAFKSGRMAKDPSTFWYKGEMGFFDNYVIPLAKRLKECGVFGVSGDEYLNYAVMNRAEWEERGEGIVEKLMDKMKGIYGSEEEDLEVVQNDKENVRKEEDTKTNIESNESSQDSMAVSTTEEETTHTSRVEDDGGPSSSPASTANKGALFSKPTVTTSSSAPKSHTSTAA